MAITTDTALRNQIIYQVFPRQYSKTHDLRGVINDLDRIKGLGVDIIQLLPVHPIGKVARKGSVGSPYSISDYRAVNPDYGTVNDLKELFDKAHEKGLKVIMDMVLNHTSKDSILTKEHPEWFYHKENGEFANRVGDWSDITDLKFDDIRVTEYLTDTLLMYVRMGCDGFRFDVASLIPYSFFEYAFKKLRAAKPDVFLFAESVQLGFLKYIRDMGYEASSDAELFNLFDAEYEYDSNDYLQKYMKGECGINEYLVRVEAQEAQYPKNYVKARYLENHDFGTANSYLKDDVRLKNMLVLSYFCRGMAFLFNGIETASRHLPDLFETDEIDWTNYNKSGMVDLIRTLNEVKKAEAFKSGVWTYNIIHNEIVILSFKKNKEEYVAIVNLDHCSGMADLKINGEFMDMRTSSILHTEGYMELSDEPLILKRI